ncbi:probable protein phosphatase 2C 51 isoform X2 [Carica papaya]|uniref:probable protein phosphatase 2C 51 isoform X2 n=1 Tax=Carica papaya TaxID=3649 RepID=UPI000B8C9BE3|nr:probable protein phosphatase 2C 51 isoform X2 [Carica papaya]
MPDLRDKARKRREVRRSKLQMRPMRFLKVVGAAANMNSSFDMGNFVGVNTNSNRKRRLKESSSCDAKDPCNCQGRNYSTVPDRGDTPADVLLSDQNKEAGQEPKRLTSHGLVSVIGRRRATEDAVAVALGEIESFDFFGVYDGHGGSRVADACRDRMHRLVSEEVRRRGPCVVEGLEYWEKVLVASFAKMDEEVGGGSSRTRGPVAAPAAAEEHESAVRETVAKNVGSTALVVMVGKEEIVVANCGDSRVVLCRDGIALPLSRDHKPDRPNEKDRVEAAGGRVLNWNGCRVLGVLATSRSIEPEVTMSKRMESDAFLIIASDGLWDVVSNEIACEVVKRCLDGEIKGRFSVGFGRERAEEAAAILAELAMARGSKDNISVIVVVLKNLTANIT